MHELEPPRILSFIPCSTWPTAPPVCVFTHSHGSGRLQRVLYAGQARVLLILYAGPQPSLISSLRFEIAGSQSIDWFWLPVTRSSMTGSVASDCTLRLPVTARLTPSVCAVPVWKELLPDEVRPLSNTWTLRSGPERPPATNARWTGPNVPSSLHGLPSCP